jgi:hypothetical protein
VIVQQALLSVSDKRGLVEFAKGLSSLGVGLPVDRAAPPARWPTRASRSST